MKTTVLLLSCILALFWLLMTTGEGLCQNVPLPDDIKIVAPKSDVPKEIAAFSGKWGNPEARPNSILIVEQINSQNAEIIYAWEAFPELNLEKGFIRGTATVIAGKNPRIEFGEGETARFLFEMQKDLRTVRKTSLFSGTYLTVTLKRIKPGFKL